MAKRRTSRTGKAEGRGKLMPMRVSDGFRTFALDQLAGVRHVMARSMFGGIGLYADGLFFGIIAADTLYFKVDATNRPAYESAGTGPFQPFGDTSMTMSYYEVPVGVLEDAADLTRWADAAIGVAAKSAKKKSAPARRPSKRA